MNTENKSDLVNNDDSSLPPSYIGPTPTPWMAVILHPSYILGAGQLGKESFRIFPDEFHARHNPKEAKERAEANAAFIVRAVNSHDALVGALEGLMEGSEFRSYDDSPPCWQRIRMPNEAALNVARAALAAAKSAK